MSVHDVRDFLLDRTSGQHVCPLGICALPLHMFQIMQHLPEHRLRLLPDLLQQRIPDIRTGKMRNGPLFGNNSPPPGSNSRRPPTLRFDLDRGARVPLLLRRQRAVSTRRLPKTLSPRTRNLNPACS